MERGVVYAVFGGQRFEDAARLSSESLKRADPTVEVAVASDSEVTGPFDHWIPLSESDGYRGKIRAAMASPFDATILMDVDSYVLCDLSPVFSLLESFDIAAAHAPNRVTMDLADVPSSFPEFNTGVVAFRRNEGVMRLLEAWLLEYDRMLALKPPSKDQPSFRRVIYRSDVRIATLAPEFNFRFEMAGYQNQVVHILHGWSDQAGYEGIGEAMNARTHSFDHWAVFAGMRLFNRHGKLVQDFGANRRLKSLRTALLRRL